MQIWSLEEVEKPVARNSGSLHFNRVDDPHPLGLTRIESKKQWATGEAPLATKPGEMKTITTRSGSGYQSDEPLTKRLQKEELLKTITIRYVGRNSTALFRSDVAHFITVVGVFPCVDQSINYKEPSVCTLPRFTIIL